MNSKNTNPRRKTFNKVNHVQKLIESMPVEHLNLTSLLNNNKDIKVYTALGIIDFLKESGQIPQDAKCYVSFYIEKFAVSVNGLNTEYRYNVPFFDNALVDSFAKFASKASNIINSYRDFVEKELSNINGVLPVEEEPTTSSETDCEEKVEVETE